MRVTASRITAFCFKLKLSASFSSSLSFFFSLFFALSIRLSIPTPSLFFFSLPPFTTSSCFWSTQVRAGQVLHQLFRPWTQLGVGTPPSFYLSPQSLSLSSPCCDRAHLLDLGYTRSESNYLIGPCSHFTVSSPHSTGFLGVKLISALFALLLLRTGRLFLLQRCKCGKIVCENGNEELGFTHFSKHGVERMVWIVVKCEFLHECRHD